METCHGEKFSEAIKAVSKSDNIVAVGLNCTSPEYVTSLLESIQGHNIQKPIIVKPNSGELWNADKRYYLLKWCHTLFVVNAHYFSDFQLTMLNLLTFQQHYASYKTVTVSAKNNWLQ